jgi:hypothetical protein
MRVPDRDAMDAILLVLRTGMVFGGEEIGRGDWDWGFGEGRWGEERRTEGEKGAEVEEERV